MAPPRREASPPSSPPRPLPDAPLEVTPPVIPAVLPRPADMVGVPTVTGTGTPPLLSLYSISNAQAFLLRGLVQELRNGHYGLQPRRPVTVHPAEGRERPVIKEINSLLWEPLRPDQTSFRYNAFVVLSLIHI